MNPGVQKPAGGYKCGPQQANCTLGPPPPAGGAAPAACQDCCGDWISEDQCDKCYSQRCSGPIPKPPTPPAPTPTPPAPAPLKYACTAKLCKVDTNGTYTASDCDSKCTAPVPPPPTPTPPPPPIPPPPPGPLKYACTAKLCKVDTNGTYTASDCDNKCAAHVPVPAPPTPPAPPGACNMSTGVNCWARPPCPAGTGHVAITRGEWHDKLSLLRCQWVRDRGWCLSRLSCAIRLLIRLLIKLLADWHDQSRFAYVFLRCLQERPSARSAPIPVPVASAT